MKNRIRLNFLKKYRSNYFKDSKFRRAKSRHILRRRMLLYIRDAVLLSMGILSAAFGLKGFLLPIHFVDGGVTGISLLVTAATKWPLSPLIVLINLPFIWLAYKQIGREFALKSAVGIAGLAAALAIIPFPPVTPDHLLVATFGGFFLGLGIGLAIRSGSALDGSEVLAIYLSRKLSLTIGDVVLMFNIAIFSVAAYILNIETALYGILTFLAASRTVDFVTEGVEEYIGVTIVSSRPEEIRLFIVKEMGRGVTIYTGLRGHGRREELFPTEILFTVITRLEVARLQHTVHFIDPNAFIAMHGIRDTQGGILQKRRWKEH